MLRVNAIGCGSRTAVFLFCCTLLLNNVCLAKKYDEEDAKEYLKKINEEIQVKTTESVVASWDYESNITDENLRHQLDVSAELANFSKEIWKETIKYPWKTFKDPNVRRQFKKFSVLGTAVLSADKYEKYNKIVSDMQSVYGKAKICDYKNRTDCSLQLEPDITEIFVKSRDPDELRYYWSEWRNAAGKPVREMYKEYVKLSNEAAVLNNFTDTSQFWLKDYEADDFKEQVEELWEQVKPLYLQLHAYVRRRLRERYGDKHVSRVGPIPAHLLGNVWAQTWTNVADFTIPYPGKKSMDVTESMVKQGYTPLRMFKLAEEFFTSLDLSPMPETFWNNSILEKPNDGRDLICHASAWDFYDGKDFRIKQCTRVDMEDLNTVHHEMGHIQYYLQYKSQPLVYKEGANPGFHEAIGDVMALSVSTPKHLKKIGLLGETDDDAEAEINQLFMMALDKIAFLPFGYLMDQFRWSVFEGKTTEKEYNCKWWQLREKYQGLSPSVMRSEDDFDPGAKYHTIANVPYIRYFVSFVIQFQFHRSLCIAAKEYDPQNPTLKPLHHCDIYQSKEAGALLKKMLQLGSSKPWPDAMEVLTGQRKMDASALLDYFATLKTWLENENARTGEHIGWQTTKEACQYSVEETVNAASASSKLQGNIMDDNVGFSYAELVRQDDNAFGVPDFMEETKPCNHLVLHRHKKSSRPEKNFWATRNSDQLTKENGMYQRGNNKALLDISDLQLLQKKLLELSQSQSTEQRQGLKQKNENTIEFKKKTYKEPFEIRSKCNDMERTKILNVLLKDIRNLKPINKQGCVGESSNINPECSLQDGGITVKRKIKNKMGSKVDEFRESKFGGKVQSKGKDGAIKYKVHKIMTLQMHPPEATYPQDQSNSDSFNLTQTLGEKLMIPNTLLTHDLKVNKDDNPVSRERDHDFLLSSNRFFNEKKNAKSDSNDLMAEAQLAMKGAEQVLKNFTLPRAESEKLSSCVPPEMREYRYPNRKYEFLPLIATNTQKNDETSRRHVFSFIRGKYPVQVEKGEAYLGKNLMNKQLNMRHRGNELDVLNVISLGDSSRSSLNRRDLPSDQHRVDERNPPTEYVMIIGKLTDSGGEYRKNKENVKKSYREYHYNVRTPVVYNSVVIASGGKPERTDDSRDFYNEYSSREFKKKLDEFEGERSDKTKRSDEGKETLEEELSGERGHFHSKSVRNTQNNIKNIYQYVGLSLPFMSRTPFSFLCLISIYSISRYTYLGVFDVVKMFSLVMEPPVLEANFAIDF